MQAVSDEQLMQWLRAGDRSCLGALFERHHGALYNFCVRLVRDRALAEDLVQDAFIRVLKARRSYRGGSFKAWLYNIARNLAFDHHRRARRHNEVPDDTPDGSGSGVDERDAERSAAGAERRDLVDRALAALPLGAREVILLGRFEFDGYEDLGTALGCSAGAAKVRMHRAMKALAIAMEELSEKPIHV